jgi:molybdopterin-guanine dinucleotide biosynthesis protein A
MANRDLTGILLVGGASRRFGSAKALAPFEGTTLAERAWGLLAEVCEERLAFGKAEDELGLRLPFAVHDDGSDIRAPIAGLVAGLRAAANDVCVVVPVDCPLLTPEALLELAAACADAAVPQSGPLPGAYARSALPVLERRLASGELSLRAALSELDAAEVTLDERLLANVNSPEELAAL